MKSSIDYDSIVKCFIDFVNSKLKACHFDNLECVLKQYKIGPINTYVEICVADKRDPNRVSSIYASAFTMQALFAPRLDRSAAEVLVDDILELKKIIFHDASNTNPHAASMTALDVHEIYAKSVSELVMKLAILGFS